ncbi:MAG: VOC family protein [Myxococcales bacterium]|nr:VOC family protein [Myxococcales bacterium]
MAGLHHLALRVDDLERAAAFYAGLLGLRELRRHVDEDGALRAIWLDLGGDPEDRRAPILMLERALRGAGAAAGSAHVLALAVDDLAAVARRLEDAGVTIDDRTAFTLFVRDPDGHRVGLSNFDLERAR